jgi:membrane protein involved in colicin uptake
MGGVVKKVFGGSDAEKKAKREAERARAEAAAREKARLAEEAAKKEKALESARLSAEQEATRKLAGTSFLGNLEDDEDELGTRGRLGG